MIDFVIDDEGDYESSMTGSDRRQEILKNIKESDRPVSGSKLAKDYDVSRQVIVQDIALLRASGYDWNLIINSKFSENLFFYIPYFRSMYANFRE